MVCVKKLQVNTKLVDVFTTLTGVYMIVQLLLTVIINEKSLLVKAFSVTSCTTLDRFS